MGKVLEGIKVLDFGRFGACPYAAMVLADMGAEVIRVEQPGGEADRWLGSVAPDGTALVYLNLARGKKGITLDLTKEKGQALLHELLRRVDIVMENYTPQVARALGMEYETLKAVNPRLIHVSITGFGKTGPYSGKTCFDSIAQAMAGSWFFNGFPGSPPTRVQVSYVDFATGLSAALGAALALRHRDQTGEGQMVDQALMDIAVSFVASQGAVAEYQLAGALRPQIGNHGFFSYSNCFELRDGWLIVNLNTNRIWGRMLRVMGQEHLAGDPRFANDQLRYEHKEAIDEVIATWMRGRAVAATIALLEEAGVPCGPLNTVAALPEDEHLRQRRTLVETEYPGAGRVLITGTPIRLSKSPGEAGNRSPLLGEHNEAVYHGLLGHSLDELATLTAERVI